MRFWAITANILIQRSAPDFYWIYVWNVSDGVKLNLTATSKITKWNSYCRPFTQGLRSHKQEPLEMPRHTLSQSHSLTLSYTHVHTHTHHYLEHHICPNKQHMLFIFYNKHTVTASSSNTNTLRLWVCETEKKTETEKDTGSFIPPSTSSVHDVCDKSQIRAKPEFPLCFQPPTPQLGLCVAMWPMAFRTKSTQATIHQLLVKNFCTILLTFICNFLFTVYLF